MQNLRETRRRAVLRTAVAVLFLANAIPEIEARAQVVERNLPPPVTGGAPSIEAQPLKTSKDATPLGVLLRGVDVIGPNERVSERPAPGVAVGDIGPISHDGIAAALTPLLGSPLSRQLISQVQAAITTVYRDGGYPFVAVIVPPQKLDAGVLQVRVTEFRFGKVDVSGTDPAEAARIRKEVRAEPGDRIDARRLEEDYEWVDRYSYHTVRGVFAPGTALGASDMTLTVTETKPWQVYAGYSNTGTTTTGLDRTFVGFGVGLPWLNDAMFSEQSTVSDNFFTRGFDSGPNQANYLGESARLYVPLFARQALEFIPSFERSRSTSGLIDTNETVFELPILYHFALSNILPTSLLGEFVVGPSFKILSRQAYFTKIATGSGAANVFELTFGWLDHISDSLGRTTWSVGIVGNPGGVLGGNASAMWSLFSNGRVQQIQYAYGTATITRVTNLPAGFFITNQLSGLAAGQPLPDTEQIALGGLFSVRGYQLNDAYVDKGFTLRNELRTPVFPLLSRISDFRLADQVSPYVFADFGRGQTFASGTPGLPIPAVNYTLASAGFGFDYTLANNVSATLITGYALHSAAVTSAGAVSVQAKVTIAY